MLDVPSSDQSRQQRHPADEAAIALCIYGKTLDPSAINAILRVAPTHAHRAGDRKTPLSPPYETGAWIHEVRRFEPINLDAMLQELFAELPDDPALWSKLADEFFLRVDLAVHTDFGFTFTLSPQSVASIAQRRATWQISVYAYGDDGASHVVPPIH